MNTLLCFGKKMTHTVSQGTVSSYRTIGKLTIFHLLILILINLQETVNFNTGGKRKMA